MRDKIRGSLIGGAVGDALGFAVEFANWDAIQAHFGQSGILRYQLNDKRLAEISDDTQMTLFTANGLLVGITQEAVRGMKVPLLRRIATAYVEWLQTQDGEIDPSKDHTCWIRDVEELNVRRAPGSTCLDAIYRLANKAEVINNSKGCGGVMRVAPIGLFAASRKWHGNWKGTLREMIRLGGDTAWLTHKHPLGYLPAAFLTYLLYGLLLSEEVTFERFVQLINEGVGLLYAEYEDDSSDISDLRQLLQMAVRLAQGDLPDAEAIARIGEGWVAEETLAIAIYCSLRHLTDFEGAIVASVNHSGDSDSTGAVTGNIMGAIVGYEAIPFYYKEQLEIRELIVSVADDLYTGYAPEDPLGKQRWCQRYLEAEPCGIENLRLTQNAFRYEVEKDIRVKDRMPVYTLYWTKSRCSLGEKLEYLFFNSTPSFEMNLVEDCLSWIWPCSFVVNKIEYSNVKQYVTAEKARLFGDETIRRLILRETDPAKLEELDRSIKHVDELGWEQFQYIIALNGNYCKFSQNKLLAEFLRSTGNAVLVDTSLHDLWGIGMDASDPDAKDPFYWQGKNVSGFALMQVRDLLKT
ncbi:ADP-ribosylglycohydrolase family protein [uncultured Parabacteroides sp.]|uniref:ADP-ribosylglycohydrolase family protein n=1 Tax=uncultured Parabacteroides sp. TaxID=512312 RepID=UPI002636D6E3|nr:ADP-ribosylglycohydrolase family protein [uncultured Parabacteroides sp.]